ncbi:MAG TPA: phospholipase D-like domain-containing protein [Thermoanaerobaculia bacterium]
MFVATLILIFVLPALTGFWLLWTRTRQRNIEFIVAPGSTLQSLLRTMAGLTWGHVLEGNKATIVQNSNFFDALVEDFRRARHHIHLETFLWEDGEVSRRIVDELRKRGADGIEVRVLVDQRGSKAIAPKIATELRSAGCDFRVYHRARLREIAWYNNRDHRKIAVIDGRVGYAFGHGIADLWAGQGWRDTAGRFEGPVVGELQAAFLDNWIAVTRRALIGEQYFPVLPPAGNTAVHVAHVAPPETASAVKRLYYLAIAAAQREIILQNPYFIPDRRAIELCQRALARGVEVKLMLPTSETSDFPIVQHASHHYYGPLLHAGARIFEYTRSGLHQKVLIIDREWCTIGSTNFDPRSFQINDEITVAMYDPAVAMELVHAFEDDLQYTREWHASDWDARTLAHRTRDWMSTWLERQL